MDHPVMHRDLPFGPPVTGAPYWYWLGGRPALDFVNTRRERWRRDVECLLSVDEVVEWLVRARLLPQPMRALASVLGEARELREAIDLGVRAAVGGTRVDGAAVTLIDDWLTLAGSRPALVTGPDGRARLSERSAVVSPRRALGMVAYDAARMLGLPAERARVRICGSATCSARFYDRSPAARRRWCSMALCGNQNKARRFRERAR
ncbi:MAG TPA: ABATE domain-containing protein [Solirubrobacteraceae bacterium]|jgi:predicted RNA-binding Zn ribbon-like protein|nr:ABATE domain-containing protein [Solirubrobacteraceae bacterium]